MTPDVLAQIFPSRSSRPRVRPAAPGWGSPPCRESRNRPAAVSWSRARRAVGRRSRRICRESNRRSKPLGRQIVQRQSTVRPARFSSLKTTRASRQWARAPCVSAGTACSPPVTPRRPSRSRTSARGPSICWSPTSDAWHHQRPGAGGAHAPIAARPQGAIHLGIPGRAARSSGPSGRRRTVPREALYPRVPRIRSGTSPESGRLASVRAQIVIGPG